MIEEFVQLLVCVINAQLLERVDCEVLETKNVQYTEKPVRIVSRIDARIDVTDEPCKCARIQCLGHGVPILAGLLHFERYFGDVAAHVYLAHGGHLTDVRLLQAEQLGHNGDDLFVIGTKFAAFAVNVL